MVDTSQFFDLYDLLVNELVGDFGLFIFLGIIIIIYAGIVQFKMKAPVLIYIVSLFLSIIMAYVYNPFIWVFIVLIAASFFYQGILNIVGRG